MHALHRACTGAGFSRGKSRPLLRSRWWDANTGGGRSVGSPVWEIAHAQHHFYTWYSVTPVIRTLAFAFRTTTELSLQKWCWTPLGLSLPNRCGLRSLPRRELCPPSGLRWWDANTARCMPRTNASHSTTLGITKSRSGAGYTFAMRSIWCVGSLGQQASPLEVVSTTCSHVLRPVDFQRISNGFSRLLLA